MSQANWQTFPIEFSEGLNTSKQPVSLGIETPGAARRLMNMEVSLDGGYKRILGYNKFTTSFIPAYGAPVVHLSGQTGTTLVVANLAGAPLVNDTFTVTGVAGTYTVDGVAYSETTRRATLTISPALDSSPADRAAVTFAEVSTEDVEGVFVLNDGGVAVKRLGALYKSSGTTWSYISVPTPGVTVEVAGAAQTGTSLNVDGLSYKPQPQDTFTIEGKEGVYTVTASTDLTAGAATLTIDPSISVAAADNADLTFIGAGLASGTASTKLRATSYRIGTECETAFVDGVNRPYKVICATGAFSWFTEAPTEAIGAEHIAFLRSTLFFGKSSYLTFAAPAEDTNFDTGDGAGVINVGDPIVNLTPFKNVLVIFSPNRIRTLTGSSSTDFQVTSLTDRIGCIAPDSVLEVGGDIMYLAPDGVRYLSDTDRSGDLTLGTASVDVRKDMLSFIGRYAEFQSLLIRGKNQYRLFGFDSSGQAEFTEGWAGTQFADQGESRVRWSQLQGFKVYSAHSLYRDEDEIAVFTDRGPYVYRTESTNAMDGRVFDWSFWSPFWSLTDTVKRKSFFKANLYTRLEGDFSASFNLVLDFGETNVVQPDSLTLVSSNSAFSLYGSPSTIFGVSLFGGAPQTYFGIQTTGAGHVFSIKLSGDSDGPPFTLDTLMIEFSEQGRK